VCPWPPPPLYRAARQGPPTRSRLSIPDQDTVKGSDLIVGSSRVRSILTPPCNTAADGFPHFPLPMKIAECPLDRFSVIFGLVECGSEILVVAYKDESCIDLAVYRLADLVIGRFVPIPSIANYALFLGERCLCVSLPPNKGMSKWLPSVSPNSVICLRWSRLHTGEQLYVQYSLSTGMWTPASDGDIVKMPPPNPHEFTHHIFTCCFHRYW
jgi:hypothetical protein